VAPVPVQATVPQAPSPPPESMSVAEACPVTPDFIPISEALPPAALTRLPGLAKTPEQPLLLTAHVLGTFRMSINHQPVENWPGGRGQAVLKYLLIHHSHSVLRDVLMDAFWPNASPEAARNRLHVALYSLRQKLRTITDAPIVTFEDGAYGLASNLSLWLDVDEFSRHVEKGGRLEKTGHRAKAAAELELAVNLYQGNLLANDPYEDWPVQMREHLRVAYIDTLDHLSRIYFDRGDYAACAAMGQLILARDNCREDTHCLLMCCYARQGQHHLALRQYQACVEALRAELDTGPESATTQLYERIRRGKPI
jgi:DNA-binding SARP family transcriptional activator